MSFLRLRRKFSVTSAAPGRALLSSAGRAVTVVGTTVQPPVGGRVVGDEIFVMTNGSSDGPNYGFDSYARDPDGASATISITRIASGGPGDRPYLDYRITGASTPELGAGWFLESPYGNPSSPTISRGQSMFLRFSYRPRQDYDQIQKIIQLVPGSSSGRAITTIRQYDEGFRIGQGIDGGDIPLPPTMTGFDTWRNIQIEVRFSTSEGATNGYHKVWVNNDTYASPTYQTSGHAVNWRNAGTAVGDEFLAFCGLHQGTVSSNLPRIFHVADFRVGPTFNSSWHASGS